MRVCILYDCLFPWTIGGAERWYRSLAERLAADGHEVTYLTLTQWNDGEPPEIPGVNVVAVGPRLELYQAGRRKIGPPLRFGLGVFWHLLRNRSKYDVVHTASFPYFSLLAAAVTISRRRTRLICDWHEVWSRTYWIDYLGAVGGRVGWTVQKLCARTNHQANTFSRLYAERLSQIGHKSEVTWLTGEYNGTAKPPAAATLPPHVVYAGRMIPEKRVPLLVEAIAAARDSGLDLKATIIGEGPEHDLVRQKVADLDLTAHIDLPGRVDQAVLDTAMSEATCVVQPSSREGYGMVVVEASAHGVPAVVVDGEDNAAVELIEPGINGFVAAEAGGESIADAIRACHDGGQLLRDSTREWFATNASRLSLESSLQTVLNQYQGRNR